MPSLYLRSNGVYYGAFCIGEKRIYRSTNCRDLEQAKNVFDRLCSELVPWEKIALSQFRVHHARLLDGSVSNGTALLNDAALRALERLIGDLKLRSITPYHVELFKSARLKEVSPITVARDYRHLKAAFNRAHKWKMIDSNPFAEVRNVRVPEKPPLFLSPEDCNRLLDTIPSQQMKAIVVFGASTGMRLGEIVNLRWVDVDVAAGVIRLTNREGFSTKNRRSRQIPLNSTVTEMLTKLPKRGEHVFVGRKGNKLNAGWVSRKFKFFVRAAGLPEGIHFHSLRHSFASWLVQSQVSLFNVKEILGHRNMSTTLVYAHAASEQLKESVRSIDGYLRAVI
jgi:integrase/recombinase XerC